MSWRFGDAYTEAHLQTNYEAEKQKRYYDQATSTTQLVPGNSVLMKNDAFQGKRKVKDQWSKTKYVVVRQVADGVPAYKVKDEVGSMKTIHRNQLFLVATPKEAVTPLGEGASISKEDVWPTRVERTFLEVEGDLPEGSMDGAETLSPTISGPETNYVERDRSWRWSGEPEQQGSPLDLPVEPLNPAHKFQIPDVIRGGGTMAVTGTFVPGSYWQGG